MITIRTSSDEVELEGTPDEFASLQSRVLAFAGSTDTELIVETDAASSSLPYDTTMKALVLAKGEGKNRIEALAKTLRISGSQSCLRNFAANLPATLAAGNHVHYDCLSFEEFLDETSPEIVLAVR